MAIETREVKGVPVVVVPRGTRLYSEEALIKDRGFLASVLNTYCYRGPEALEGVATRYGRDLASAERALVRLVHTIGKKNPIGVSRVLDTLGIMFTSYRDSPI